MKPFRPLVARIAASALLLLTFFAARSALADPHTEAAAKEALGKAQNDYVTANYAAAEARLKQAVHACGANRCGSLVRATLLRDLGVMQFRTGDKSGAAKSFGDALALEPALVLDPNYDASDVGAAYEDARAIAGLPAGPVSTKPPPGGAAGPAPTGGAGATGGSTAAPAGTAGTPAPAPAQPPIVIGEQPTGGDFAHDPPLEQRENTPLPIYAEYSGSLQLVQVVLKYKGAQMREWTRIEMRHAEGNPNGWEAVIPCGDVTRGVMRYWIQGFDKTRDPVAASGDPKHPFQVPIRDKITSEAPRLPGKEPPRSCEESDCPPGIPGCNKGHKGEGEAAGGAPGAEGAGAGGEEGGGGEGAAGEKKAAVEGGYARIWIGGSISLEFVPLPSSHDVCRVNGSGAPANPQGYYCYGFDPIRGANANFPSSAMENAMIPANGGGDVSGTLAVGDVRLLGSIDYALTPNVLAGARVGFVANAYPGRGQAFAPVHIEARGTYLLGNSPLSHKGAAGMGFVGLGVAEFDGRSSTNNVFDTMFPGRAQTENVWLSNGPFFITLGAGGRFQTSAHLALTAAARLNLAFGSLGVLPTFGPEFGVAYGF